MPASKIQANYDDLAGAANTFSQQAGAVSQLLEHVLRVVEGLAGGGWTGVGASAFFAEMNEQVAPAMRRFSAALDDACTATQKIVSVFREAEGEAARCFDGASQARVEALHASAGTRLAASAIPAGGGLGLAGMGAYRPSPFHHWTVIRGFERVTNGNTFVQVGPTCTLYSALNLLRFSGHRVNGRTLTQADADQVAQGVAQRNWWRPDILVTDSPELGYAMSEARRILDTHGAAYTFSTARNFAYAPNAAEQYLVYTVQTQQKPVLVATKWSAVMGLPLSSHAYNVIGVHTDNQGRLEHVLVSTNWAGQNAFMEIPAREFLDAWKKNDYETIVLN